MPPVALFCHPPARGDALTAFGCATSSESDILERQPYGGEDATGLAASADSSCHSTTKDAGKKTSFDAILPRT
jgi:hypothetical protein